DRAAGYLERGLATIGHHQHWFLLQAYSTLTLLHVAKGQPDTAVSVLDRLLQPDVAPNRSDWLMPPWLTRDLQTIKAGLHLHGGNLEAARDWAQHCPRYCAAEPAQGAEQQLDQEVTPVSTALREQMMLARVYLAEGRAKDASTLLMHVLEVWAGSGNLRHISASLMLLAASYEALGDTAAVEAVGRALTIGERGGFLRTLADEGAGLRQLIAVMRNLRPGVAEASDDGSAMEDLVSAPYIERVL